MQMLLTMHRRKLVATQQALIVPALNFLGPGSHVGRGHRLEVLRVERGPQVIAFALLVEATVVVVHSHHDCLRNESLAFAAEGVLREVAVQHDLCGVLFLQSIVPLTLYVHAKFRETPSKKPHGKCANKIVLLKLDKVLFLFFECSGF